MDILDIFYNYIIKEASIGRIDCYMYYNIIFKTSLLEDNIFLDTKEVRDDILVPTLIIKNKTKFNELLIEYVNLALDFYDDSNYEEEVLKMEGFDSKRICKEKVIMAFLWANATIEDFNNPINYLQKRIDFLTDNRLLCFSEEQVIGYSEILQSDISIKVSKDINANETPYKLMIKCINQENGDYYLFPSVKLGLSNNTAYIYAIQTDKVAKGLSDITYSKKVNRLLFKVGENFDSKTDNFENYDIGNLKDVSASFLLSACIALSLLDKLNIDNISIPSILIERWNSKKISLEHIPSRIIDKDNYVNDKNILHDNIQTNLTDKLIRTFNRLDYHFDNINITSYPSELDSNLRLIIRHSNVLCNNMLLQEVYSLVYNYSDKKHR